MRSWLPAPVLGTLMLLLLVINTLLWSLLLFVFVFFKLVLPFKAMRQRVSSWLTWVAQSWAACNNWFVRRLLPTRWVIDLDADLSRQGQYLACANHQSWNDIVALMYAFQGRAPFFKFFLKQELIWVPILGLAWWALDYPFMKRYTREQIERNPALKGKDMETTRKACEKFREQPVMVLNFLEGTRFTPVKHERQQSPYHHLLKPKAGGLAFATAAFGERINTLMDITIVYPQGGGGIWDLLCGRVPMVVVEAHPVTIPHAFYEGDYENDLAFRQRYQDWVSGRWQAKDVRIGEIRSLYSGSSS